MTLTIKNLSVKLGKEKNTRTILKHISLEFKENEFISIVGPSGCGKTTLLNAIAGLVPYTGTISLNGKITLKDGKYSNKKIGYVFQHQNLFPWRTVSQNVAYGLELKNVDKNTIAKKVKKYVSLVGLTPYKDYYPYQLSGGMQQRVAIARTLITNPDIVLMDEPFASLDHDTRSEMQKFLLSLWEKYRKTIIFVTHNIDEGILLADRVVVLKKTPAEIKKEISVNLPRPRHIEAINADAFNELKRKCTI